MNRKLASTHNWPDPTQRLLLRAVLSSGDRAAEAWQEWLVRQDIDAIDTESFSILPQLYLNLTRNGIRDQYTERLKGVYRQVWARNQMTLRGLATAIDVLNREGIRSVLTKGMALAMFHYDDLGARFMYDCDLAVEDVDFAASLNVLQRAGWSTLDHGLPLPPDSLWDLFHAWPVRSPDGQAIDLHRRILSVDVSGESDSRFHQRAVERVYQQLDVRIPDATDTLLITCYHARKNDPQAKCRWVVDLLTLLNNGPELNWDEVLPRAASLGQLLPVRDVLTYAQENFAAPVPTELLDEAWRMKVTSSDAVRYRRQTRPWKRPRAIAPVWSVYSSVCLARDESRKVNGFLNRLLEYCQWKLGTRTRWQVPWGIVRELVRPQIRRRAKS